MGVSTFITAAISLFDGFNLLPISSPDRRIQYTIEGAIPFRKNNIQLL